MHIVVSEQQGAIHEIKGSLSDGRKKDFVDVAVR